MREGKERANRNSIPVLMASNSTSVRLRLEREAAALMQDVEAKSSVLLHLKGEASRLRELAKTASSEKDKLEAQREEAEKARFTSCDAKQLAKKRIADAAMMQREAMENKFASEEERKRLLEEAERIKHEGMKGAEAADHEMTIYVEKVVELERELERHRERVEQENYNLKIAEALAKVEREKAERLRLEGEERRKQMELEVS